MCPTPEFTDLNDHHAALRTVEVAAGILMYWDNVEAPAARIAIHRMAIRNQKTLEEVATAIICFAALGRRETATAGA